MPNDLNREMEATIAMAVTVNRRALVIPQMVLPRFWQVVKKI
jgi:hypothetical protein